MLTQDQIENQIVPRDSEKVNTVNPVNGFLTKAIDVGLDLVSLNTAQKRQSLGTVYPTGQEPTGKVESEKPSAVKVQDTPEKAVIIQETNKSQMLAYVAIGGVVALGALYLMTKKRK